MCSYLRKVMRSLSNYSKNVLMVADLQRLVVINYVFFYNSTKETYFPLRFAKLSEKLIKLFSRQFAHFLDENSDAISKGMRVVARKSRHIYFSNINPKVTDNLSSLSLIGNRFDR